MFNKILKTFFVPKNEKYLKNLKKDVVKVNELFKQFDSLTDEEILNKSLALKLLYQEKMDNKTIENKEDKKMVLSEKILKEILPEAFALMKQAIKREFKIELYDVQLLGGMVLHYGNIAEMKTGEGKTYTAILPAYLNALTNKQVHVVTVNDYLAKRDAEKVSPVFKRLGISVGCSVVDDDSVDKQNDKKRAYQNNIVYGTSSTFGFDFLNDNSVYDYDEKVMKERYFAIVDEVDSVLIDEARTPLIISGEDVIDEDELKQYLLARDIILDFEVGDIIEEDSKTSLKKEIVEKGDLKVDLKSKTVVFTENGLNKITEKLKKLNVIQEEYEIYLPENLKIYNMIQTAANVEHAYKINKDYLVKDGKIIIIDPMTGRVQPDRKWSNGVHQAIEVKEGVELTSQNKTIATTTLQHYFNKYEKLSGMTGTADTEALEFFTVYGLETFVIPTNKKIQREDFNDRIFLTKKQKDKIFIELVKEEHEKGRPILIGTNTVKENEYYSNLLKQHNLSHEVLNAKNHLREAEIISKAGERGAITLATNMAGRGTDIILGGNFDKEKQELIDNIFHSNQYINSQIEKIENIEKKQHQDILDLGGLLVISLGRNESRRVDNQLRGRAGRQGDVGASVFLISFEDDLLQLFMPENLKTLLKTQQEDTDLGGSFFSKQLTKLQKRMEEYFFEMRKRTMDYAKAGDTQTDTIYKFRDEILLERDLKNYIKMAEELINDVLTETLDKYIPLGTYEDQWDIVNLENLLKENGINLSIKEWISQNENNLDPEILKELIKSKFRDIFDKIKFMVNEEELGGLIKYIYLKNIDHNWMEHLTNLEYLRNSINLKGYSGKDPKEIFKKEAFELFNGLIERIKEDTFKSILNIQNVYGLNLKI